MYVLRESIWFVAPVALVTLAWAMAIPLVLGSALSAYGDCRGTAGAFFGLFYYVLIGAGLLAAGWGQSLERRCCLRRREHGSPGGDISSCSTRAKVIFWQS